MGTRRLYYTDSYLASFRARVVDSGEDGRQVVLDRSAFYPSSGGQPADKGWIADAEVQDVREEDGRIVHAVSKPLDAAEVDCAVDWSRRFDHMQQHTGQHLLSAVLAEMFGVQTVSFHMGPEAATIDLACPALTTEQLRAAEARVNRVVQENRAVSIGFEDAADAGELRKASGRGGTLRIVTIQGLDRSACGGTHVKATGEIGVVLLRSTEKVRGNVRLEFLCGQRAVQRARADYAALDGAARVFSAGIDEVLALVRTQADRLKNSDKVRLRLEEELAGHRGTALYSATNPEENGIRLHIRLVDGPFPDDLRSEILGFARQKNAVFVAVCRQPRAALLASSSDSGVHCGTVLKQMLAGFAGKGGGSAQLAQGSFEGDPEAVRDRLRELVLAVVEQRGD